MLPPDFQQIRAQTRIVTPKRVATSLVRMAIAGAVAFLLSAEAPWVMTLFYVYVGFNVLVLVGFWAFSRFLKKKLSAMSQSFQGFGSTTAAEEDLGEAEIIEDTFIEDTSSK